ncbi:multiheme c-type cytochrome [Niabella drilacis]|uniref:Cytochrome c554 and c-prime n=1 Tax=Niabella drilacis (strain DSM 25811 / CCM 8410 / CCUG 62505 / LMG 26954 / E90) TaxID=1285928 RepID=A0A1G6PXU2_NIADE|nr:multiheme c-type cytochrome [Niabella drilacis]SDC84868.1 Cytochrome c554 and c-prime [Niabella drilacis]
MKIITALLFLAGLSICLFTCTSLYHSGNDPRGTAYAGSGTCGQCHRGIAADFVHANHFRTSSETAVDAVKKVITSLNDTVRFPNGQLVLLEAVDKKAAQVYMLNGKQAASESMDVAFGSGEKAWTFGYWKEDQLHQLPLTYLSELKRWTNSPGLPADHPDYSRLIVGRCMECHSSYAAVKKSLEQGMRYTEKIDAGSVIYGIDCERCHGPAAQHVAFHQEHPQEKRPQFITAIRSLSRQQQLDLCGTCHSGDPVTLRSIFAFVPGDSLSNYYMYYPGAATNPDAHGMQMQSLMQSQCFLQSNLTCTSCHDTHKNEGNMQAVFVQRCMSCHLKSDHAVAMRSANNDCISCHMPLQASKSLDFNNSAEQSGISYRLRTHRIAIYPESAGK